MHAAWQPLDADGDMLLIAAADKSVDPEPNSSSAPNQSRESDNCTVPNNCNDSGTSESGTDESDATVDTPADFGQSATVPVGGGFEVEAFMNHAGAPMVTDSKDGRNLLPSQDTGIGVKLLNNIERKGKETGVKFGIGIRLAGKKIRLVKHIVIKEGQLDSEASTVSLVGVELMKVGFAAGSSEGLKDSLKVRVEYAPSKQFPGPDGLVLTIGTKFFVDLAFTSKDSTIWRSGK